jgi:hypothetical protein
MWITHSYLGINIHGHRCLFFLLFKDYIEAEQGFSTAVTMELERFARDMGNFGAVVRPFPGDAESTRNHILDKEWNSAQQSLLSNTPAVLVIDRDFNEFNPRIHNWCLFHVESSDQGAAQLRSLLTNLTGAVKSGGDPFQVIQDALLKMNLEQSKDIVGLRLTWFGISVDLRTAWRSLKAHLRNSARINRT